MKIHLASVRHPQGNALLITVLTIAIIAFLAIAYLQLISHQNVVNARSQSWNSAMPIVEAGLEHALAHMNNNLGVDLARDGWRASAGAYVNTRPIADEDYAVVITNYTVGVDVSAPEVVSIAYVKPPHRRLSAVESASQNYLTRGVRIRCRMEPLFSKALVAKYDLNMSGNNVTVDSYDSMDPNYSTLGIYDPAKPRKGGGDVASVTGLVNVQNADIYGHLATGPGGSASVGAGGRVGDVGWTPSGADKIQPGWYRDDLKVQLPDVKVPFTGGGFTPTGGCITNHSVASTTNSVTSIVYPTGATGKIATNLTFSFKYPVGASGPVITNRSWSGAIISYRYPRFTYSAVTSVTNNIATCYDYILDDGDYELSSLNGKILVLGQARLYVAGSLEVDDLDINPGATLNLYSGAASPVLNCNSDYRPGAFTFWGLPSCTSIDFTGNQEFTGTVYAPNAALTIKGGGTTALEFIGAAVVKSAKLTGHVTFHYDESLARTGPIREYIVASWNEMSPPQVKSFLASILGSAYVPAGVPFKE